MLQRKRRRDCAEQREHSKTLDLDTFRSLHGGNIGEVLVEMVRENERKCHHPLVPEPRLFVNIQDDKKRALA